MGPMCASNAMNGNIVAMVDVEKDFIKCLAEIKVSVRNMTEIALDPVSSRWDVEAKTFRVCDLSRFFGVACSCETGDNQLNLRKLCWLPVLLTSSKVDCGVVGESYDGCMVAGLMY